MFGLKPWDADGDNPAALTWGEMHEYLSAADEHARRTQAMDARSSDPRR